MKSRRADTAGPDTDRTPPQAPVGGPAPGLRPRRHGDDWWSPARARARKRRQVAVGVLGVYSMLSNTAAPLIKIAAAPAMNSVGAASLGAASLGAAVLGPGSALAQSGAKGDRGDRGEKGDKGDKGEMGADGDKGEKGAKGLPGPKGNRAAPGPKGEKGLPGNDGLKGELGRPGDGPAGPEGR